MTGIQNNNSRHSGNGILPLLPTGAEPAVFNGDTIADIANYIRNNNVVVLYDRTRTNIYHQCERVSNVSNSLLNRTRILLFDVSNNPNFESGQWSNFLTETNCRSCRCSLRNRCNAVLQNPNRYWQQTLFYRINDDETPVIFFPGGPQIIHVNDRSDE
jgi:hypothetical protein